MAYHKLRRLAIPFVVLFGCRYDRPAPGGEVREQDNQVGFSR